MRRRVREHQLLSFGRAEECAASQARDPSNVHEAVDVLAVCPLLSAPPKSAGRHGDGRPDFLEELEVTV